MECPKCGAHTNVVGTATGKDIVIRKRKCVKCGKRFTTSELWDNTDETRAEFVAMKKKYMVREVTGK